MTREQIQKRTSGMSANALVMPIVLILAVLHIIIILLILTINTSSSKLSSIMQNQSLYTQEATSLLAGSSLLSETSSSYILMPLTESGESNVGPLVAYAEELAKPEHRGDAILANFRTYNVPQEALNNLQQAADSANYLLDCQLHVLALYRSVYSLPPIPQLDTIPSRELTQDELAMSTDEKLSAARGLLLSSSYSENKGLVSRSVNACVAIMQQASGVLSGQTSSLVIRLRRYLWVVTLSIMVILILTFITLYRQLLNPLGIFVRIIPTGHPLDETSGFREVRLVASAYNEVLKRRDSLDAILRSAAETDTLTNLPNRYRFEQYVLEAGETDYSVAVLLFDVNYLKRTNDTEGHLAGDKLIRTAANCISACFGENCFRFGGDEFAAVVINCTPESIERMVERFKAIEKEENVSISLGYAYTDNISNSSFRKLLDEADKNMYKDKEEIHRASHMEPR